MDVPHGGLRKITSISFPFPRFTSDSAYETKSPSMNSIRSATPRWSALCLASRSRIGLLSIAITTPNQYGLPQYSYNVNRVGRAVLTSLACLCELNSISAYTTKSVYDHITPTSLSNMFRYWLRCDGEPASIVEQQW